MNIDSPVVFCVFCACLVVCPVDCCVVFNAAVGLVVNPTSTGVGGECYVHGMVAVAVCYGAPCRGL